ncbi:hypothetical protein GHT06_011924 [Daphnia sinensis]|uniref:Uncharacterized protein n=1 Tax=Daphnia sinensis TaxID=1820382 RepID=A0AAD5PWQ2_9CRUS|nr:hypothetical protein GHT06_011924 [Daphnia sinensis]
MNSSTIRKLPGSKKAFAHVKSVVDHRRPHGSKAPNAPAVQTQPDDKKPRTVPTRPAWNSSTKIERTPDLYIKPLPGTGTGQRKSFKARSVPASHLLPFRPVLPSKTRQPTGKADDESVAGQTESGGTPESPEAPQEIVEIPEKAAEVPAESADPGLMSRVWQSVVGPIVPAAKPEEDNALIEPKEVKEATGETEQVIELPEDVAEKPTGAEDPGLIRRMWHSVVDPILNSNKPGDEGAGEAEEVAVKQPESEAPPVTEEPGVPAVTEEGSPASEESVVASVAEDVAGSSESSTETAGDQPEGPSAEVPVQRKYPPGYGSKRERIRKALEKKGIMPGDELPPKKPFKNQGPKRSKSPTIEEIVRMCARAQEVYGNRG